jgi:hypothetical protein
MSAVARVTLKYSYGIVIRRTQSVAYITDTEGPVRRERALTLTCPQADGGLCSA